MNGWIYLYLIAMFEKKEVNKVEAVNKINYLEWVLIQSS